MTTITRPSPLCEYDRRLLTIAANKAQDITITADNIWTVHIDSETNTFWIHCRDGKQLPFNRDQFRTAIDAAKPELAAQLQAERSKRKEARELKAGDRIKFEDRAWTVTSVKSQRVQRQIGRSPLPLHTIQFDVAIFDGIQTQVLKPYSEADFEIAA